MSFEESLVHNASPTLASLKVSNLYNFKFGSKEECDKTLNYFNRILNPKGIYIEFLKQNANSYLIFIYRKSQLIKCLENYEIRQFLCEYGYQIDGELIDYVEWLKNRLKKAEFPHEIGIFLGYPIEDVKAFIETEGQNCKACGDWKVYHDEQNAKGLFCKYKRCKEVYKKVYSRGRKFEDMLVGA